MSGLFGVITKKDDCMPDLFYLGDYHSHLGTQFGGIAVFGKSLVRKIHNISNSQFKSKLLDEYNTVNGNKGIGVVGYEEQPIYVKSKFGDFCIAVNGWVSNWKELSQELYSQGYSFSEISDSRVNICELISKLIIQKDSLVEGIEYMYSRIDGSASVLILSKKGIYVVRDKLGISSLAIGKNKDRWAVASETTAFLNLDYKIIKYLSPGEIVFLGKNGLEVKKAGHKKCKICAFLWIYTGFPASSYEGINTETVREKCGSCLAKNDQIKPDLVCGVPDSGTAHALGYAMEKKIPYRRPLVKYTPGYGRSYLPPSQKIRDLVAKMKLIPIKDLIRNKKIVLCDDSIVRGTQLKNYTVQKLRENQAKEVHVRIACPPLMFPCKYSFSTRTRKELAARKAIKAIEKKNVNDVSKYVDDQSPKYKKMVSWIANDLGVNTLKYQKLNDMVKAIGLSEDRLCLYCWTGKL